MFKPKTLRALSVVAIIICIFSALLSLVIAIGESGMAYVAVCSWATLAYASYCAMKLSGYDIYESDLRKLGWSIYILFAIFIAFLFIGLSVGPLIALAITARLHFQKTTLEEWMRENPQS
ncbi:hypothetical protein F5984_22300 [Rudanella paleaurantiibacter]|uniref:Uncharacterized protein n=1 Tax=Rudanella paleaurantiibacter TaxID=2614655 RepID=A0A7J5TTY3_9BACT|nr:hypothetical protein [Rudanella paleaurantiibacter]KAB7727358.1 hypothetical protein F5984_22300 [Rudanella paleaurantiibacter]